MPSQAASADPSANYHETPLAAVVMLCTLDGSHLLNTEACSATPAACCEGNCSVSTLRSTPWTRCIGALSLDAGRG